MTEEKASYRQIVKATSIFGGVQIFMVLISILRSKFIAVLLGPAGMGIVGLLSSATGLISAFTNFGLGSSAVKDVSAANSTEDENRIAIVIRVFRKLVWITGLLGAIITLVLSPWLSRVTFGDDTYTFAFIWLSISLLSNQLSAGQIVLLQGLRKIHYLAKANMVGAIFGLLISVPIYYYLRIDGVVLAIILSSLSTLLISWFFSRKIKIKKVKVDFKTTLFEGKNMMRMGFMISLSSLITLGASYLVRIFISQHGGLNEVGLYNAGFAIINTYVGLVFSAMGTDYYPRLSAVSIDNKKASQLINQQAEISTLIIAPILTFFLIFINWIVIILYSNKFLAINGMVHYAAMGMYFKAASWSVGFIFLAKGASKIFFWSELSANIYLLLFNLLGYYYLGLNGMGISFLVSYILFFLQVFLIAKIKYDFTFHAEFYKIFIIQIIFGILCFLSSRFLHNPWSYYVGLPFISLSIWYSYYQLNKRIEIASILISLKNKILRK